jgi:hypothetical protein
MAWLGRQAAPKLVAPWKPPVPAANPASGLGSSTSTSGAGNALIQAAHDAAKQAFLFGLKIAFRDSDREASAKSFLAATSDISQADRQNDQTLQSLTDLAHQIVAKSKNQAGSIFLSVLG